MTCWHIFCAHWFETMKRKWQYRQSLISGILLAVFLNAFLLSSFHRHEHKNVEHTCALCEQGIVHFDDEGQIACLSDFCQLCSFCWAVYLTETSENPMSVQKFVAEILNCKPVAIRKLVISGFYLRAPPALS